MPTGNENPSSPTETGSTEVFEAPAHAGDTFNFDSEIPSGLVENPDEDEEGGEDQDVAEVEEEAPDAEAQPVAEEAQAGTSPETIEAIKARHKNDPDKLAAAVAFAQQQRSKEQSEAAHLRNELAALRASATSTQTTAQPQETSTQEQAPLGYDPNMAHSERGWPINPHTGQEFMPVDNDGVPFTPQSVWEQTYVDLADELGDDRRAAARLITLQNQAERNRQDFIVNRERGAYTAQAQEFDNEGKNVVALLSDILPEAEIEVVLKGFAKEAVDLVEEWKAKNQLSSSQRADKTLYAAALKYVVQNAQYEKTLAAKIAKYGGGSAEVAPIGAKNGAKPKPVATEGTNGASSEGRKPVSRELTRTAAKIGMDVAEVEKYSGKEYTFLD